MTLRKVFKSRAERDGEAGAWRWANDKLPPTGGAASFKQRVSRVLEIARGLPSAAARLAILTLAGLLAGCHGSTLDSLYPGSLGHTPPPAVNLPPQDCPAPPAGAWPRCLPRPPQSS